MSTRILNTAARASFDEHKRRTLGCSSEIMVTRVRAQEGGFAERSFILVTSQCGGIPPPPPPRCGAPCCVTAAAPLHHAEDAPPNTHARTLYPCTHHTVASILPLKQFCGISPLFSVIQLMEGVAPGVVLLNSWSDEQSSPGCPPSKLHRTRTWHRAHFFSSSGVFEPLMDGGMDALARGLVHKNARLTSAMAGLDQSGVSTE